MPEEAFVELAKSLGVDKRIDAMIVEIDQVIHDWRSDGEIRWLYRLEAQRRLLTAPTLRVYVALMTRICEERPELAGTLEPRVAALTKLHPEFVTFQRRIAIPLD